MVNLHSLQNLVTFNVRSDQQLDKILNSSTPDYFFEKI